MEYTQQRSAGRPRRCGVAACPAGTSAAPKGGSARTGARRSTAALLALHPSDPAPPSPPRQAHARRQCCSPDASGRVCLPAVAVLLLGVLAVVAGVVAGQGGLLCCRSLNRSPNRRIRIERNRTSKIDPLTPHLRNRNYSSLVLCKQGQGTGSIKRRIDFILSHQELLGNFYFRLQARGIVPDSPARRKKKNPRGEGQSESKTTRMTCQLVYDRTGNPYCFGRKSYLSTSFVDRTKARSGQTIMRSESKSEKTEAEP